MDLNPFDTLRKLHKVGSAECLEWSIAIDRYNVRNRHKPTLYLYQDNSGDRYKELTRLLGELACPEEVIQLHNALAATCTYQALRISSQKTLYIRPSGYRYLDAYRWKDPSCYDLIRYPYKNIPIADAGLPVHSWLKSIADGIRQQTGIWLQEHHGDVHEVYPVFPGRAGLDAIILSLQDHVCETVIDQLLPLKKLKTCVMGFTTMKNKEPELTIYFSVPTNREFPKDHDDAVRMTLGFFNEI